MAVEFELGQLVRNFKVAGDEVRRIHEMVEHRQLTLRSTVEEIASASGRWWEKSPPLKFSTAQSPGLFDDIPKRPPQFAHNAQTGQWVINFGDGWVPALVAESRETGERAYNVGRTGWVVVDLPAIAPDETSVPAVNQSAQPQAKNVFAQFGSNPMEAELLHLVTLNKDRALQSLSVGLAVMLLPSIGLLIVWLVGTWIVRGFKRAT